MISRGIQLKIYNGSMALAHRGDKEGMLRTLLWSFGVLSVVYLLILGNVVWNIVERKGLESEARALANEVSDMELKYLSLSSSIGPELGRSLGFIETKNQYFATRQSLGTLSFLGNEL